jgi:hypothetical protein
MRYGKGYRLPLPQPPLDQHGSGRAGLTLQASQERLEGEGLA